MNCTHCQHSLPKGANFCPQCGEMVIKKDTQQHLKKQESSTKIANPAQAYMLVVAALAIAILIVVFILDSNQKTIEQNKNTSTNTRDLSGEINAQLEKIKQDPESVPLNIEMGNLLFDSGRFDEAIPFYQKALSSDSENISVQIDLAVCYFNLRKTDQAIMEMNKALKIDPNHSKGLFNMGIIYYNLGQFEKVREYWQRLIAIHPDLPETFKAQELLKSLD